ncbi:MAG: DnaA N-terminal domain-containing protein, partial [Actinomycetota bacterium]
MSVVPFEGATDLAWNRVAERLRGLLPESSYAMWFAGVRATDLRDGVLEVGAPTDYVRDWLLRNHLDLIRESAALVLERPIEIEIVTRPLEGGGGPAPETPPNPPQKVAEEPAPHP